MGRGIQWMVICALPAFTLGKGQGIESGAVAHSNPIAVELQAEKARLDSSRKHKNLRLEILVKEPGKRGLTPVVNDNWPNEIETTYDLWKDAKGRVRVFGEYPYSQSGDWHLGLEHYFNEKGETFAFEKKTNFFNSPCTSNVALETETLYFDSRFSTVLNEHTLQDLDGKTLDLKKCTAGDNWPFKVSRNLADCIARM